MIGAGLIAKERERQVNVEGYNDEHDDSHGDGSLAMAAAALATYGTSAGKVMQGYEEWGLIEKHKDDRMRQLVIAGALIAAEIDRVYRLALARCPECEEIATGYERGVEMLDGVEHPGTRAKIAPCGCITEAKYLPNPFRVGVDTVIPS